ncbi:hypothetical protein GH5_04895 [Leishmania sp. Ghana 2012 LV757]|uniref:hypothetical protein n=1 Tax=Leishmania sp. Ghana 2012 LV757 TaxID=2803181 RepID=UPI001B4905F2|nr:hypothetical protein GH5_04895 [Leishmania sp. Ghana 2012 LV757]
MASSKPLPVLSAASSAWIGAACSLHSSHGRSLSCHTLANPDDASVGSPCVSSTSQTSAASEESAATSKSPQALSAPVSPSAGRRVVYFVDHSVTAIAYAEGHLMRPSRVRALHALVHSLGLDDAGCMTVCHARPATAEEMGAFHRGAYLECLRQAPVICGNPLDEMSLAFQKEFDVPFASQRGDCPLFPEVWTLVTSQAGASLACAEALVRGDADVAMNWAGGMHHAAAAHASGFCFVNDIVLCIRRLLRHYQRVLYIDLDVHHGDGVEGAFYGNHRVMTLSLHQFGSGFFPGTGDYPTRETADSFAVNVPLPMRTGDAAYLLSFRTALSSVVQCFDPEAVVLQCGADTITGDLIGRLCVTTLAHTQCVADVLSLERPTVLLGGGGYHVFHTARCWAIHTATALGRTAAQLPLYIPRTDPYYMDYRRECTPKRPTLHVFLDPDVDDPLPLEDSLAFWRQLCRSIQWQMRTARFVRQRFSRTVQVCRQRRSAFLRQFAAQDAGGESGVAVSGAKRPRSKATTERGAEEGVEDRVVSA